MNISLKIIMLTKAIVPPMRDVAEEVCADDYAADRDHAGVGDGGDPADSSLALALDVENIEEHKQAVDRAGGAGVSARE